MMKKIIAGIAVVILALFVVDQIIFRFHLVSDQFGEFDEKLWVVHTPNRTGTFRNVDGSLTEVRINSDGFRDREFLEKKGYRILMFGDSYTASFQVPQNETSSKFLERSVRTIDIEGEVFNLGVPGYSPATYFILLNETIKEYGPDLVIFNVLTANDISASNHKINGQKYPYFTLDNESLVEHEFRKSEIYEFNERYGFLFPYLQRFVFFNFLSPQELPEEYSEKDPVNIYLINQSQEFRDAWNIVDAILQESKKLCEANGCEFFAVTLTNGPQTEDRFRQALFHVYDFIPEEQWDMKRPERDFIEQCEKYNVTCLTTLDEFIEIKEKQGAEISFERDPHYNSNGARIHAEILFEKIKTRIARR